jgi:hypothetical protein
VGYARARKLVYLQAKHSESKTPQLRLINELQLWAAEHEAKQTPCLTGTTSSQARRDNGVEPRTPCQEAMPEEKLDHLGEKQESIGGKTTTQMHRTTIHSILIVPT